MSLMDITKFPIDVGIGQPEHGEDTKCEKCKDTF